MRNEETQPKYLPIIELIARTDALMIEIGYHESTMRRYRQAWNALKNHALKRGETVLTTELGYALLREHYKIEPYTLKMSASKQITRRAVMLLLENQTTGRIYKRFPNRNHTFPDGFSEAGESYLRYSASVKQLKESTLRNHRLYLEAAFAFFVKNGADDIRDLTVPLVNEYLITFAGCTKRYISDNLNILNRFLDFAHREGYIDVTFTFPIVSVLQYRNVPEYYKAEEITAMLAAIDRANPLGKRDYAMLLLGMRYGLRVCDIKAFELKNIDFANHLISITQIKTGKPLSLHLLPDVGWAIIDYLKNGRPVSDAPQIFIRHVAPCTSFSNTDRLAYIIAKYARAAGIQKQPPKKGSFHMLRFGLANHLLQKEVPLTTISGILGHSELNVTTLYTKINVPQLRVCALEVPQ